MPSSSRPCPKLWTMMISIQIFLESWDTPGIQHTTLDEKTKPAPKHDRIDFYLSRLPRSALTSTVNARRLKEGVYLPPARAHRHLTKPESRYSNHGAHYHTKASFQRWDAIIPLLESNLYSRTENLT